MIIKSTLFILGLIRLASGQYDNHHQQFFYTPGNSQKQSARFDTKALTPVRQTGNQKDKLKWTFASTHKDTPDSSEELFITKLGDNLPNAAPFTVEEIRRYFEEDGEWDIDVEDIILDDKGNPNQWHYIVCGQVVERKNSDEPKREGFIARIKASNGNFVIMRRYPEVFIFKSIVVSADKQGYVAVGQYQKEETSDGTLLKDAVFVAVKKNNLNPLCAQRTRGIFKQQQGFPVYSRWNKIIQYQIPDDAQNQDVFQAYYAVVGETEVFDPDLNNLDLYDQKECKKQGDVLVGMMTIKGKLNQNPTCEFVWDRKYGGNQLEEDFVQERGLSIAQYGIGVDSTATGQPAAGWLVVTGNTKRPQQFGDCRDLFNDVLAFRIDATNILNGNGGNVVTWWNRYNIDTDQEFEDVGTAVQITTDPNYERRVLVAGECVTQYEEFNSEPSTDAFLLELQSENGNAINRDVFFLQNNVENGALYDYDGFGYEGQGLSLGGPKYTTEGKLDLHLTLDHHAVIMGNAKVTLGEDPGDIVTTFDQNNPYLVERYITVNDVCFDERNEIETKQYEFKVGFARTVEAEISKRTVQLETEKLELRQEIVCEKSEKDPTKEPTPAPTTPEPTSMPTNAPTLDPTSAPTDCFCTCEPTASPVQTDPPTPQPVPTFTPFPPIDKQVDAQLGPGRQLGDEETPVTEKCVDCLFACYDATPFEACVQACLNGHCNVSYEY